MQFQFQVHDQNFFLTFSKYYLESEFPMIYYMPPLNILMEPCNYQKNYSDFCILYNEINPPPNGCPSYGLGLQLSEFPREFL